MNKQQTGLYFIKGQVNIMEEIEKKRIRRTPQQLAEDIDAKLEKLNQSLAEIEAKKTAAIQEFDSKAVAVTAKIEMLQKKKEHLLAPKQHKPRRTKKQKIQEIVKQAQKSGLKVDEIAERLGVSLGAEEE